MIEAAGREATLVSRGVMLLIKLQEAVPDVAR